MKKQYSVKISGRIDSGQIIHIPEDIEKNSYLEYIINSTGGDANAVIGMFDMLEARRKKQKIITIGVGTVESAAFWLFISGDERCAYKNTKFMFHSAYITNPSSFNVLFKIFKQYIDFILNPMLRRVMKLTTKKDFKFWYNLFTNQEVFLSARELKKLGIVTKIL